MVDTSTIFNKSESSIKVERNTKGYVWEIKKYGDDLAKIADEIKVIDEKLRSEYAV